MPLVFTFPLNFMSIVIRIQMAEVDECFINSVKKRQGRRKTENLFYVCTDIKKISTSQSFVKIVQDAVKRYDDQMHIFNNNNKFSVGITFSGAGEIYLR